MSREHLRHLPNIDRLLKHTDLVRLLDRLPRSLVLDGLRATLDDRRTRLLSGTGRMEDTAEAAIVADAVAWVTRRLEPRLVPVINATGVVLHTNLGRAPLSRELLQEAIEVAAGYSNLEYDLEARGRGSRYDHSAKLLSELTGAEDSLVVNNNAGAVLLMLGALALDREVIVSRGELVEIGGSFRLPDIMSVGGARLVEVGTTNRTHLRDYANAIGDETGMLLKVHRSNFEVVGFTHEVGGRELATLGHERGVPACEDLGSGALSDLSEWGIDTHTVKGQIAKGLDLVTFSGDKLLGGPQAGIIVGRRDLVERCRRHPLTRALRVDKLTLATLERTLVTYVDGRWKSALPAFQCLSADRETLDARAQRLADLLRERLGDAATEVRVEDSVGRVGGGAMPMLELPGRAVRIRFAELAGWKVDAALRDGQPPVVCRIDDDALVFDLRTVFDDQVSVISERLAGILGR